MASTNPLKSMEGTLWILPDGPNTDVFNLGCHMLNDVSWSKGSNTPIFCSGEQPNTYRTVGKIKGPPELVSLSVETDLTPVVDYLEDVLARPCEAGLLVTQVISGKKSRITNWVRGFIFPGFDVTSEGLANLVGKDTNDRSTMSVEANANEIIRVYPLKTARQSVAQATAINHIFACDEDICQSAFSTSHKKCGTLYATSDAVIGSAAGKANVLYNDGDGWAAVGTDPFATSEHISAGVCFPIDNDNTRILVFRGSTDVGNPAEAAYINRGPAGFGTWVQVNVGSVVGEFVSSPRAAYAVDDGHIWVGTDGGYIYFSSDGGVTWEAQEEGVITTDPINFVHFIDERNGIFGADGDVVAITSDGGATWSQTTVLGTADDVMTGWGFNAQQWWVGTNGGELWYTNDGGITWAARTQAPFHGTGSVVAMSWVNQWVGVVAWANGSSVTTYYFTKDGGRNWEAINTLINAGVNSILMCSTRQGFAVGEVQGGTGVIHTLVPMNT